MTEFLALPPPLLLLLPMALAAGVDLYLTLLALAITLTLGESAPGVLPLLPPAATAGLTVGLALLYLLEAAVEFRPTAALVWHNLQLVLRPLGAGLLALMIMNGSPTALVALGVFVGALVAAFAHVLSWGQALALRLRPARRISPVTLNLAEDTGTLVLLALTLERPDLAFVAAGLLLLTGVILGSPLHRVARFGVALFRDRVLGVVSPVSWTPQENLPGWIRRGVEPERLRGLRGVRGAAQDLQEAPGFREGWVLDSAGELSFAFRTKWQTRIVSLGILPEDGATAGRLATRVLLQGPQGPSAALFLQRGGPCGKPHK